MVEFIHSISFYEVVVFISDYCDYVSLWPEGEAAVATAAAAVSSVSVQSD